MLKHKILAVVSVVATAIAAIAASSACIWFIYQPEEPASLQER